MRGDAAGRGVRPISGATAPLVAQRAYFFVNGQKGGMRMARPRVRSRQWVRGGGLTPVRPRLLYEGNAPCIPVPPVWIQDGAIYGRPFNVTVS